MKRIILIFYGLILVGTIGFWSYQKFLLKKTNSVNQTNQTNQTNTNISDTHQATRRERLSKIDYWAYQIQKLHEGDALERMIKSNYQMVVIDDARTINDNRDYDQAAAVKRLKASGKLTIAYIDIGEAEDYRDYWQTGWKPGDPDWIVADDPDGWEGNFPVKYWRDDWQTIIFGSPKSYLDKIIADGFDGIYLDWIEAATFDPVIEAANAETKNATNEMIEFIRELANYARAKNPNFIFIAQNAVELGRSSDYLDIIDALAQEQIWFDGDAEPNGRAGDVAMPAETVGEECDPVCSTAYYLEKIKPFQAAGLPIFTVDYAAQADNVKKAYAEALKRSFVPYVSTRQLDRLTDTPPPNYK